MEHGSSSPKCEACGDYPVSHFWNYIDETFNVWMHDRLQSVHRVPVFARFADAVHSQDAYLTAPLIRGIHALCGGKTSVDPTLVCSARARTIWDEAKRRDMEIEQILLFGAPVDFYRVRMHDRWVYFKSLPVPPQLEAHAFEWSDDKLLFKQFLQERDIPAARGFVTSDLNAAKKLVNGLDMPVVVKPRIGSNSRHTTPLVGTPAQFDEAFRKAQQLCRYVLVEEHIHGNLCRATVVGGELVAFLESKQPQVRGDGVHTIQELVSEKNAHRHERISEAILTGENESFIVRQGYSPDSIPEKDTLVRVGWLSGRLVGGETREMPAHIHPKLRACVERVAQLLRAPIVGFDLIIEDPTKDPDEQRWGILEANTVPFIEIHSDPLYGEPSNVAAAVWDLWD